MKILCKIQIQSIFYKGAYSKENAPTIQYNGSTFYAQTRGYVYSVIMGVKNNNQHFISEIVNFLAPQIRNDCILIPAPQHTGKAEYTLSICNQIKEVRNDLDIDVADILSQTPRDNYLKELKKTMSKEELNQLDLGMNLKDVKLSDKPKYLVDNTISTGKTFDAVRSLIPDIQPLAFSIGSQFLKSHN